MQNRWNKLANLHTEYQKSFTSENKFEGDAEKLSAIINAFSELTLQDKATYLKNLQQAIKRVGILIKRESEHASWSHSMPANFSFDWMARGSSLFGFYEACVNGIKDPSRILGFAAAGFMSGMFASRFFQPPSQGLQNSLNALQNISVKTASLYQQTHADEMKAEPTTDNKNSAPSYR